MKPPSAFYLHYWRNCRNILFKFQLEITDIGSKMCMSHIVICSLPGSTTFLRVISKRARFKKKILTIKRLFWASIQFLSDTFLIVRRTKRDVIAVYVGLHVQDPLFLPDFNKTWIFSTGIRKILQHQISQNPPSGSRVVPCGRKDGQTDMTLLIAAFRNFANAPKN